MERNRPIAFALGLLLAACTSATPAATSPDATPSPTATAPETERASPSPTETSTAQPSPSPESALDDPETCTNDELDYSVSYPGDWWANERIEPDDPSLTPIAACQYFAREEVALQPNAGLPNGIAVYFNAPRDADVRFDGEIVRDEELTIDGREARVVERRPNPSPGFVPEGSVIYTYVIQLSDGSLLTATTDNILQDDEAYETSKQVLDAMMETIEIRED